MKPLGIISGTIFLHGQGIFTDLQERAVENEFGKTLIFLSDMVVFIPRHGKDLKHYILPHLINHQANMQAFKDLGVEEVIGVNSAGSLKRHLKPGMLVVPDDFIMFSGGPTIFSTKPVHITPTLSEDVRKKWIEAAHDCGVDVVTGGIYWQTTGPRLETKAEIRAMSMFADLVGMTMASEAVIAEELGLSYAALCSVDNYGHGLEEKELTTEKILWHARKSAETIIRIITKYIERKKE